MQLLASTVSSCISTVYTCKSTAVCSKMLVHGLNVLTALHSVSLSLCTGVCVLLPSCLL